MKGTRELPVLDYFCGFLSIYIHFKIKSEKKRLTEDSMFILLVLALAILISIFFLCLTCTVCSLTKVKVCYINKSFIPYEKW